MKFNHDARRKNVFKATVSSGACNALLILVGFGYRMVFLHVFSLAYMGINSLFGTVLSMLSLADLNISNAIIYRLYEPISTDDVHEVGKYMRFFRDAYRIVAGVIFVLGLCLMPFLPLFIKSASEVPADVNLYVVFFLFLLQTASSYLFSYKLALLSADQRQHQSAAINALSTVVRYTAQILFILLTRNYMLVLVVGILVTIALNWLASAWVTRQYPNVFLVADRVDKGERKAILGDTSAAILHKVGGIVLNSTDNILISKFIGLGITGAYANYSLIIFNVGRAVQTLFGGFVPSMGNAHAELSCAARYAFYKKALFLNLALTGLFTTCLYSLIEDFILLWVGEASLLGGAVPVWLCIQFYIENARCVSSSYIDACGLFTKDKPRPIIESILNLVISFVALQYMGVAGVIVGTIVSCLLTVFWREPYLLYHYAFEVSVSRYWIDYLQHLGVTLVSVVLFHQIKTACFGTSVNLLAWVVCGVVGTLVYTLVCAVAFWKSNEFRYYWRLVADSARRGLHHKQRDNK
ncbi:MAG: hypothetical protein Q4A07_00660 [Coriobacteriales bacterium]|nr:hypothetical protein [Coriobacteriales bacterium]